MKAVIRIVGKVGIEKDVKETLNRLRIRKKFSCVILRGKPEIIGMIEKVRNFVAYGDISKETFIKLLEKRGKKINKQAKLESQKIAEEFFSGKIERNYEDFNLKPFFSLHPPRGGIKTKIHFPKGVLGNHQDKIKLLIERML